MARRRKGGIPGVSFSWKRATGVSALKAKVARQTGIPTTKAGRQRKVGRAMGCCIPIVIFLASSAAILGAAIYGSAAYAQQSFVLYRCQVNDGAIHYTSTPAPGCVVVTTYRANPGNYRLAPVVGNLFDQFDDEDEDLAEIWDSRGYPCTIDCSGHEAGYQWAEANDIDDPDDCGGNSQSFTEGCMAYAEGY